MRNKEIGIYASFSSEEGHSVGVCILMLFLPCSHFCFPSVYPWISHSSKNINLVLKFELHILLTVKC